MEIKNGKFNGAFGLRPLKKLGQNTNRLYNDKIAAGTLINCIKGKELFL